MLVGDQDTLVERLLKRFILRSAAKFDNDPKG